MDTQILRAALRNKAAKDELSNGTGFTVDWITDALVFDFKRRMYMADIRAAQQFDDAANEVAAAKLRLHEAMGHLIDTEKELAVQGKASIARMKDLANQLGESMVRLNKMLGPDFDGRIEQLERVTKSLSVLSELNSNGRLASLLDALKK